jgi:hypothetical protein
MIALGVAAAAVVAFLVSFAYYALMPSSDGDAGGDDRPKAWQIGVELVRSLLIASLIAGILSAAEWHGPGAGALLGLSLWILPFVLLAGSVLWEGVAARTAALHAGDWLIKLPAVGAIVGFFV